MQVNLWHYLRCRDALSEAYDYLEHRRGELWDKPHLSSTNDALVAKIRGLMNEKPMSRGETSDVYPVEEI